MTHTPHPRLVNGRYLVGTTAYPRVTTILGVISKPGLEAWRHKLGIAEAEKVSRTARELGTLIHAACEVVNRAAVFTGDEGIQPFVDAYRRWFDAAVEDVLGIERFLVHERHAYAGTADLVARLRDGRVALVDIKSSNSLDGTYRLQTSAYADALAEAGEPVDVRMVVQLPSRRPGELRAVEYDDDERDLRAWRACLRLWRWNERHAEDWRK